MLRRFNDWLADRLAQGLSTMAMFWIICAFVLLPLLWQTPEDLVGWIQYLVQSFFQGVALPVLAFVAKKSGESLDKTTRETHDMVMVELGLLRQENKELRQLLHDNAKVLSRLEKIHADQQAT